jgi:hypothetical protein
MSTDLALLPDAHVYVAVVGIASEPMASLLQRLIDFIEQYIG